MNLLITILVGAIAGWLADLAFKRFSLSLIYQIVLGIAGAFVGSWFLNGELHTILGLPNLISRILEAFIGAAIILLVIILLKRVTSK